MRAMMANRQDFDRHLRPEDLLLVPPFPPGMGILDWHRHTELMHEHLPLGHARTRPPAGRRPPGADRTHTLTRSAATCGPRGLG